MPANATINFNISSENAKGGKIEIRSGAVNGKILGTCIFSNTNSWKTYQTISCKLNNVDGTSNLYFIFKGGTNELLHLDWFNFSK